MFPLVAGKRDFPIVDILAIYNHKVDVVIFEHSFFDLVYHSPHTARSKEGVGSQVNDDIRAVERQLRLLPADFPHKPDSIVAAHHRPQKAARGQAPFRGPSVKQARLHSTKI